ncbi:hypothetical protein [Mycolicibacterium sarraceniae]|uniref:Uncharacterized protein n=1 Tax=Mycolicibacterium sarraceniae TaxID=1534348 RepID=A0A7I7SYW1_9MYCO|nr:hypothetical protein [Mycolicibacterium sarraceniae]BBY61379.1 hypothetical protein MSAR_45150 [Mycolicibacterium sarraceniae]
MGKAGCSLGPVVAVEVGVVLEVAVGVGLYVGVGMYVGVVIVFCTGGGAAGGGGATVVEGPALVEGAALVADGGAFSQGAGDGSTTGTREFVCTGDRGMSSGGVGVYRSVAITRPRTARVKIVITIPRRDMRSFNFSSVVIHSTGARR